MILITRNSSIKLSQYPNDISVKFRYSKYVILIYL